MARVLLVEVLQGKTGQFGFFLERFRCSDENERVDTILVILENSLLRIIHFNFFVVDEASAVVKGTLDLFPRLCAKYLSAALVGGFKDLCGQRVKIRPIESL